MRGTVREGDWVKTTDALTTGLSGTIRRGTQGVVTSVLPGWFTPRAIVTFDGGFGTVRLTVPVRKLRVVRRDGGVERFNIRHGRVMAARAALALFTAWPVISWAAQYLWVNGDFSGIEGAFALGLVDSFGYYVTVLATDPVRGVVYLCFLALAGRLAWR
jgi:hypothetical protein